MVQAQREQIVGVEPTGKTSTVTVIHTALSCADDQSDAALDGQAQRPRSRGQSPAVSLQLLHQLVESTDTSDTVMTVRDQNGDLLITDGPFAETKEQMLG